MINEVKNLNVQIKDLNERIDDLDCKIIGCHTEIRHIKEKIYEITSLPTENGWKSGRHLLTDIKEGDK